MKVSRGAKDAIKSAAAKGQVQIARAIHKKGRIKRAIGR